jgi:hypothetical protein
MNAEPDLRRIPVIVMSSSGAEKGLVRAYSAQISAYLVQSSNFEDYFNCDSHREGTVVPSGRPAA